MLITYYVNNKLDKRRTIVSVLKYYAWQRLIHKRTPVVVFDRSNSI